VPDSVEATRNPVGFVLTGGEAHDQLRAGRLLAARQADMLIAGNAIDPDEPLLEPQAIADERSSGPKTCADGAATSHVRVSNHITSA